MRQRITKRSVEKLVPAERPDGTLRRVKLWDTDVTGFGCVVTPTGHKSYIFQYRTRKQSREQAPKRITLGRKDDLTPDQARDFARDLLVIARSGGDPAEEWRRRRTETFGRLAKHFLEDYLPRKKRPPRQSTVRDYRSIVRCHLLPRFGKRRLGDFTTEDIERFHRSLRATPYQANRALGLLRQLFTHAERLGWRRQGSNPAINIERYPEEKRGAKKAVMLTPEQMAKLLDAIRSERAGGGDVYACAAIEIAFWTGWRISEVLNLQWDNLDLAAGVARLEITKTASEEYRSIPKEAVTALENLDRLPDSPHVFPGRQEKGALTTVRRPWQRIRKRAGLHDLDGLGPLRLHDLRHNVVSWDVSRGVPLEIAGKNVGHRSRQATEVYAHFAPDALKRAADDRAQAMRSAAESAKSDPS